MVYSAENFYKTFESVRKRIPYKIYIKSINPGEILLRSDMKDLDETALFIEAYEEVTHSRFKTVANKSTQSLVCRRKWMCNHSVVSGTDEKCPASINILIKKNNKHNRMTDAFLRKDPPHPAVIKINANHNHPLMVPVAPHKLLKVNNGVKECFYEYFKRGYYGARAKCLHEQNLRKANFYTFEDESMNPSLPAIFALYNDWLKIKGNTPLNTGNEGSSSSQVVSIQENGINDVKQSSSQNVEDFISMEDIMSKVKKEPIDEGYEEYGVTMNIISETIKDTKPVFNIKQEVIDEDETDGLPVISSYGSLAAAPTSTLPSPVISLPESTTARMPGTNFATSAVKVLPPPPTQVVYDQSTNTYKVVTYLAINADTYSANQYKSYLPSTLLPARISLQKL